MPGSGPANANATTFTQVLYDEVTKQDWMPISMKSDWNQIFSFDYSWRKQRSHDDKYSAQLRRRGARIRERYV
jgi:hypothetical protein